MRKPTAGHAVPELHHSSGPPLGHAPPPKQQQRQEAEQSNDCGGYDLKTVLRRLGSFLLDHAWPGSLQTPAAFFCRSPESDLRHRPRLGCRCLYLVCLTSRRFGRGGRGTAIKIGTENIAEDRRGGSPHNDIDAVALLSPFSRQEETDSRLYHQHSHKQKQAPIHQMDTPCRSFSGGTKLCSPQCCSFSFPRPAWCSARRQSRCATGPVRVPHPCSLYACAAGEVLRSSPAHAVRRRCLCRTVPAPASRPASLSDFRPRSPAPLSILFFS